MARSVSDCGGSGTHGQVGSVSSRYRTWAHWPGWVRKPAWSPGKHGGQLLAGGKVCAVGRAAGASAAGLGRSTSSRIARVRGVSGEHLTVATLNTRGIPVTGSRLADRYAVIGAGFDAGDVDVACFQEVLTYWHLRLLVWRMRSFRQVSYRPAPAGPAP